MKFSIKDFCSKCDQIHRKLQIWSLKKSLMENFIFFVVVWAVEKLNIFLGYIVHKRKKEKNHGNLGQVTLDVSQILISFNGMCLLSLHGNYHCMGIMLKLLA